jgi:hypothetical protein
MTSPASAQLVSTFQLNDFGSGLCTMADINNDGKLELLFHQTAGQLRSEVYGNQAESLGIGQADKDLYCLTATNMQGEILWQDGTPWNEEYPYTTHGGSDMLLVDDINNDGKIEIVVIRKDELAVINGDNGDIIAKAKLPADNYFVMITAQLGDPVNGKQIVLKVTDKAYSPWKYGNPIIVYNADLTLYHEPFAVRGAGHNMVAISLNEDERDSLFIGYSRLDNNCNEIWRLDLGLGFDYEDEHADSIMVSDVNNDGKLEVQYAGSDDFFVVDLDGNILWSTPAGHSQLSVEGPWGPNGEKRIIMSEKNQGLWGLNSDGNILWNRKDINGYATSAVKWKASGSRDNWALFLPSIKPINDIPYKSQATWSNILWPRFIDGDGELIDVFPWDESCRIQEQHIRAKRSYDAGIRYNAIVKDIDNDGVDEVLVYNRDTAWFFKA